MKYETGQFDHETGQCANAFFSFMAPIAYGGSIFSVVGH
jgi:hypothetical protein